MMCWGSTAYRILIDPTAGCGGDAAGVDGARLVLHALSHRLPCKHAAGTTAASRLNSGQCSCLELLQSAMCPAALVVCTSSHVAIATSARAEAV